MSRIDELIAKHCPSGVRHKAIGDIAKCYAGATPRSGVDAYWTNGTIPWMGSGEVNKKTVYDTDKRITKVGFDSCSTRMVPSGAVVIALAGQGKTRGLVARTRIELCTNQSLCSIITDEQVDSDYLYFYLTSQYQKLRSVSSGDGTRGGLNLQMIRNYIVPVPPIEVQREIVNILDKFTQLETELETELEARKKQYEYYRNILVDVENSNSTALTKLIDVCKSISSGKNKSKNKVGSFPVFGSTGVIGYTESPKYKHDTLLVARVGANAGYVHKSYGDYDVSDNTLIVDLKDNVNLDYIYYLLVALNLNQYATGGGQPLITGGKLKEIIVPIPPIEKQNRIASTLNNFDKLVNDISVGLPAELNARRKQYEYYRDKLLTFEELNV